MTDSNPPSEERAIYIALAMIGMALVGAAVAAKGPADAGATFGLAFVALAIVGLASQVRATRRHRLPGAYARRRR